MPQHPTALSNARSWKVVVHGCMWPEGAVNCIAMRQWEQQAVPISSTEYVVLLLRAHRHPHQLHQDLFLLRLFPSS